MTRNRRGPNSGAVTSISVAHAAGVSQSTVSLVMSGKAAGRVSEATRILVEKTAQRLGYQPNASAQVLRTGSLKVLALAVPNVEQPYFGKVLVRAELAARENGYSVLLIDTSNDTQWSKRLVGMIRSRLIAGCIVYAGDSEAEEVLRPVGDSIVYVEAEDVTKSSLDLDVSKAMSAVVRHLVALGHQHIGYFAADYPKGAFERRLTFFKSALKDAGLSLDRSCYSRSTFDLDASTDEALGLLRRARLTALFCDDDILAAATYRAARQLGIEIPADLSVVGFNDVELARILWPELTTVSIPVETVARRSVDMMIDKLRGGASGTPSCQLIQLSLTIRGSTARAIGT